MSRTFLITLAIVGLAAPSSDASWLSKAVRDTSSTVHKAVADTGAEIDRAKQKVTGAGASTPAVVAATQEIDRLGEQLKNAKTEKIEAEAEKDVAHAGLIGLSAAVLGGLIAMTSTGMFGRHDRREKYLAAVLREIELDQKGFDFGRLPRYKRLCRPNKDSK